MPRLLPSIPQSQITRQLSGRWILVIHHISRFSKPEVGFEGKRDTQMTSSVSACLVRFFFSLICLSVQFGIPPTPKSHTHSPRKFPGLLDNGRPVDMRVAICVFCRRSPVHPKAKEITTTNSMIARKESQIKRTMGERQ